MIAQLNKDAHVHHYTGYQFRPVRPDNSKYQGNFNDYAFIYVVCKCEATKPLEYGKRRNMETLYMDIKRRFTNA